MPNPVKRSGPRFGFIGETIAELKKVTWLKWPNEVLYLTALVIIVAASVGAILGAIDYGLSSLVNSVFIGG